MEITSPALLGAALTACGEDADPYAAHLSFTIPRAELVPAPFDHDAIRALDFAQLHYGVEWPLNIVINARSIVAYNKVFHLFVRLRRTAWTVADMWSILKRESLAAQEGAVPQQRFRAVQMQRHEMQHFISVISEYFCHEVHA